jgi:hypothetical protein
VRNLITQSFPRYHWLPPLPGTVTPCILDFQVVESAVLEELNERKIVAQLQSPLREQVPARYAAYMSRVGTPDFTPESIQAWISAATAAVFPPGE